MNKLLAIVAAHLRRFAGNSSDKRAESGSPFSALSGATMDDLVLGERKSTSNSTLSTNASNHESASVSPQARRGWNEQKGSEGARSRLFLQPADNPSRPDFITREELKRELNLLRHLIESRK